MYAHSHAHPHQSYIWKCYLYKFTSRTLLQLIAGPQKFLLVSYADKNLTHFFCLYFTTLFLMKSLIVLSFSFKFTSFMIINCKSSQVLKSSCLFFPKMAIFEYFCDIFLIIRNRCQRQIWIKYYYNKQELLRTCDDLQFIIMNEVNLKENDKTINDFIRNKVVKYRQKKWVKFFSAYEKYIK